MDRSGTRRDAEAWGRDPAQMVGLDGPGMRGPAQVLALRGDRVSGSVAEDGPTAERLRALGIRVHAGHPPRPLSRSARVLIHGADVPRTHPARLAALVRGIEQATGPEMVGRCLGSGIGLAVAGGRRAGVAAAMIGWTLAHAGQDPTVLLDTFAPQLGGWGRPGGGPHVVAEVADEAIGAEILVLLDDGGCPEARARALGRRAESASGGDYLLGFADEGDPATGPDGPGVEVERFSLAEGREWWGADVRQDRGGSRFRAFHRGRFVAEVRLRVHGPSAVVSALAAVAACARVDLPARAIKEGLEEFAGVSRGFESRGSYRGVTLVDDEARGPCAAREALEAARRVYGRRRLCVAYRPEAGGGDGSWPTAGEFAAADRVWIIDEEGQAGGPGAGSLAEALLGAGARVDRVAGLDGAIRELDRNLEPGDVLMTLGAGDVGTIADAFLRRLSRDRHA